MSLIDWAKNAWLRPHQPQPSEIQELLAVADRDLQDALAKGLSDDWRFGIAYNAALQLARAALHASGYETPKGESHHFRAIGSLVYTLATDTATIDQFQTFRTKRSTGVYEAAGRITQTDAQEMLALAQRLRREVEAFIRKHHPHLLR